MEEDFKNEEGEKIKISKDETNNKKKIITIIAVLVVLFLGVNTFAATQGYNNIFFIIRNLISPEVVNNRDEILLDRDITISYQPIKISSDLNIQINKLIVQDEDAVLYLDVTNNSNSNIIANYVVYDITDGKKELIGNQMASETVEGRYVEKIELVNFLNETKILQLEIFDDNHNKISALEINLDKKEINILQGIEKEVEKISEVELKEFLAKVVRINFFGDNDSTTQYHTVQEYKDEIKVLCALEFLNKENASFEEVHNVIKEFAGETSEKPLSLANIVVTKYNDGYKYTTGKDEHQVHALCLEITDIKCYDAVYTVNCVYTYPTDEAYRNNTIEELDRYTTTIDFVLNDEYEYSKYCILNLDVIESHILQEADMNKDDINNEDEKEENSDIAQPDNFDNTSSNTTADIPDNSNNSSSNTTADIPNNSTVDNKHNTSINTVPINPKPNYEKVDNYASTMQWSELYTPGLKTRVPSSWNVEVIKDYYSGEQDDGLLAVKVSGLARGINKETNEIIDSNMTIKYYMPDFVEYTNLEDFANSVARKYGANNTGCGYGDRYGNTTWRLLSKGNSEYYCHFEPVDDGNNGIGYVVEFECDNFNNYKVTNILNWIIPDIKTTSF